MANLDLTKYGITGTVEIVHNPSYDVLFAEETKAGLEGFEKGKVTELGAVNVMPGIYTGRSPKDLTELFLSTPSARRATAALRLLHPRRPISIHALREEGDYLLDLLSRMTNEFLSTPSARRSTLTEASGSSRPRNFYPRPPRGGRPGRVRAFQQHPRISIHALREEGDSPAPGMSCTQHNFYPRPPRGGRPDPL